MIRTRHGATPRQLFAAVVSVVMACTAPPPAHAGPFDQLGFGARSVAMGGASTASVDDYTAVYHNPALLPRPKVKQLGLTLSAAIPNLTIESAGDGANVGETNAPNSAGISIGALFPFGGRFEEKVAIGISFYSPTARLLRGEALDPTIPRWQLWQSGPETFQWAVAGGAEIKGIVRGGIGMLLLASVEGRADIGVDLTNEEITRRSVSLGLQADLAPNVGVSVGPVAGMEIGATYRGPLELSYDIPILFDFGDALQTLIPVRGNTLYTPAQLQLGISWGSPREDWTLSLDAQRAWWSNAPDPSLNIAIDVQGELSEGLNAEDALDMRPSALPPPEYVDTWELRGGAEYLATEHVAVRAGYGFRPSPIPEQTGTTNYIDATTHTFSAGLGVRITDRLTDLDRALHIDLAAFYKVVPTTTTTKASAEDPVGDLRHGGTMLGLHLSLYHDFR